MIKFKYLDPNLIMTIVISLIILAIGVFAFFIVTGVTTSSGYGPAYDGQFTVTDSTVTQNCGTGQTGMTGIVVTQYNGVTWTTVAAADYTYYTGNGTLLVSPSGMD